MYVWHIIYLGQRNPGPSASPNPFGYRNTAPGLFARPAGSRDGELVRWVDIRDLVVRGGNHLVFSHWEYWAYGMANIGS